MACKEWHDLPANETKQRGTHQNPPDLNPNNLKIVRFRERMKPDGSVVWNFFPDQCRHCLTPICKDVADMAVPGAIIKDAKTGMVIATDKSAKLSPQDAQAVIDACPYNIPRLDPKTKCLTKCDMCIDRVTAGMLPICQEGSPVWRSQSSAAMRAASSGARILLPLPDARGSSPCRSTQARYE